MFKAKTPAPIVDALAKCKGKVFPVSWFSSIHWLWRRLAADRQVCNLPMWVDAVPLARYYNERDDPVKNHDCSVYWEVEKFSSRQFCPEGDETEIPDESIEIILDGEPRGFLRHPPYRESMKALKVIELGFRSWRTLGRSDHPMPNWPKDCLIVLRAPIESLPRNASIAAELSNIIMYWKVNRIVITDSIMSSSTLFWLYMALSTAFHRTGQIAYLCLHTCFAFPTVWLDLIREMVSGEYSVETLKNVLTHIRAKDIDQFLPTPTAESEPEEQEEKAEGTSEVEDPRDGTLAEVWGPLEEALPETECRGRGVGALRSAKLEAFQKFYEATYLASKKILHIDIPGRNYPEYRVGNIDLTSDWYLRNLLTAPSFNELIATGVPEAFPSVLPDALDAKFPTEAPPEPENPGGLRECESPALQPFEEHYVIVAPRLNVAVQDQE